MYGFPLNFTEIIKDEIKIQSIKTNTIYPFPFLVTKLYEEVYVTIRTGVNNTMRSIRMHTFDRARDESTPIFTWVKKNSL